MGERARRLRAGAEAGAPGHGGVAAVARATGLAISTVRKGRDEVRAGAKPRTSSTFDEAPENDRLEAQNPQQGDHGVAIERLVDPVTRGDPESPLRWTSKSTHALSAELFTQHGIRVSDKTVAKLLRERLQLAGTK